MELSVNIGGITFEHPVMNAAGTIKLLEQVRKIAETTSVSAIMVGSGTVQPRQGNPGRVYYVDPAGKFTLNSLGLPNPGMEYYRQHLPEMREVAEQHGKKLVFSAAGFSSEEFGQLTQMAGENGAHVVEVNLDCPNVIQGNALKPVISYDLELVNRILEMVAVVALVPVWIKVSPNTNPAGLVELAAIIKPHREKSSKFVAVTGTNTIPSASAFDEFGKPAIEAADNFAGMAGPALKPFALGNVRKYRQLLPELALIAAGGISSGADCLDYRRAGACIFQMASAFLRSDGTYDYDLFRRVLTELVDLLEKEEGVS